VGTVLDELDKRPEFKNLILDYPRQSLEFFAAEEYMESGNIAARLNLPNMAFHLDQKLGIYTCAQEGLD
jgi:hypothetical protein